MEQWLSRWKQFRLCLLLFSIFRKRIEHHLSRSHKSSQHQILNFHVKNKVWMVSTDHLMKPPLRNDKWCSPHETSIVLQWIRVGAGIRWPKEPGSYQIFSLLTVRINNLGNRQARKFSKERRFFNLRYKKDSSSVQLAMLDCGLVANLVFIYERN